MIRLVVWQAISLGLALAALAVLLVIWWRQQNERWLVIVVACLALAPALSAWSSVAFHVADYRAGCDGLCPGFRGAPLPTFGGETAGGRFLPGGFILNSLVYLILLLGWMAVAQAILRQTTLRGRSRLLTRVLLGLVLWIAPFALAPLFLPAPEAHVRGDPQRIAINARREVYLYDQLAPLPILRGALEDVRPRTDSLSGMRVCLRTYTFFYLPVGYMYLDMTPEGVHSNAGGVLPRTGSCWR